jgi:imidazole glycerol phosphate synthase subunit HisF
LICIDKDGTNSGFDLELINQVRQTEGYYAEYSDSVY